MFFVFFPGTAVMIGVIVLRMLVSYDKYALISRTAVLKTKSA